MPDDATATLPETKEHWKTREKREKEEAAARASAIPPVAPTEVTVTPAPPEAPPAPPAPRASEPAPAAFKILPFDEFMLRFFTSNSRDVVQTVQANEVEDAGGAMAGLAMKCYHAYQIAMKIGMAAQK